MGKGKEGNGVVMVNMYERYKYNCCSIVIRSIDDGFSCFCNASNAVIVSSDGF
jgi:hypothetical protein